MALDARRALLGFVLLAAACSDDTGKNSGRDDASTPETSAAGASAADAAAESRSESGSESESGSDSDSGSDSGSDSDSDSDAAAGTDPDPCSIEALREPRASKVYYVAIGEPGADDQACDGLAPSDQGNGHCPFRDFDSDRTRALLDGVADTEVELRAGTYALHGWDGLRITGTGSSEVERVMLSAYPGEHPVLDVASPDGQGCTAANAPDNPQCVREVLRISGTYTLVQGITVQNGLGYHVEITGGAHHQFRCNTLHETVAFPMRSDCMKIDAGANDVQVLHNDFSRFRSQAIDMTDVHDVLIEDNEFHDPVDDDAGATGSKLGASAIVIRNNRVHDMGPATSMHAFSLGGTGTLQYDHDHAASELQLIGNQVWNIAGIMAQLVSCASCTVEDNTLWNAGGGLRLSSAATGSDQCGVAGGCGPNQGTRIRGNRMRALDGGGDAAQANVFVFVDPGEAGGLRADDNVYCAPAAGDARFGVDGELVDFSAWQAATSTDATSAARASSDASCVF